MPKIVDHDQRRSEIVDGFLRVVARDGYDRATTRALAEELGVASGALWHYFQNLDAVLEAAALRTVENTSARIARVGTDVHGLDRVAAIMRELLPLSKETRDEAAVIVGFWGRVATHPGLTHVFGEESAWWESLRGALQQAIAKGELAPQLPVEVTVRLLASLTAGQQISEVVSGGRTTAEEHRALVDAVLQPWLPNKAR